MKMRQKDFDEMRRGAFSRGNEYFGIRWKKKETRRLGIVVGKKSGTAVQRNKIKRVVRELFRLEPEFFPQGDNLIIAREKLADRTKQEIRAALIGLLKRK